MKNNIININYLIYIYISKLYLLILLFLIKNNKNIYIYNIIYSFGLGFFITCILKSFFILY